MCEGLVAGQRLFRNDRFIAKELSLRVPRRGPIPSSWPCTAGSDIVGTVLMANRPGLANTPWRRSSLDLKMKAALARELRRDGRPFWE